MDKPELNPEFAWTVQHIDDQYWWFDADGEPNGPYSNYDSAERELDEYCFNLNELGW